MHKLSFAIFLTVILIGCKDNNNPNNNEVNSQKLKDSSTLYSLDTIPFVSKNELPNTTNKEVIPQEQKQVVPDLLVESVEQKSNDEFKTYYSFQVKNNTDYPLKSFKFAFIYTPNSLTNSNRPQYEYEYVIIKQYLSPYENAVINVYVPEKLLSWEESGNTIIIEPKLYGAISSENKVIYTSEGDRIERKKLDDFLNKRMEEAKNAGKVKY